MMTIVLSILSLFTFFIGFCFLIAGFKKEEYYFCSFIGIVEIIYVVLVMIYLFQAN